MRDGSTMHKWFTRWVRTLVLSLVVLSLFISSACLSGSSLATNAIDALGSGKQPSGEVIFDNLQQLSPDGQYVAYVTAENLGMSGSTIWVRRTDSTVGTVLVKGGSDYWVTNPVWSYDSQKIAYLRVISVPSGKFETAVRFELWIINVSGSDHHLLTDSAKLVPSLGYGGKTTIEWNTAGEIEFDDNTISPPNRYAVNFETLSIRNTGKVSVIEPSMKPIDGQINSVPLLKQCSSPWGSQQLGTCSTTMCSQGCAVTAAAMVFQSFGVNVDPGSLNTFLKSNNNFGYSDGCLIKWDIAANYASGITWIARVDSEDWNRLNQELDAGYPVIVAEPGHFVVVTYRSGGVYYINDPAYNRTTLADYGNHFLGLRIFHGGSTTPPTCSAPSNGVPRDNRVFNTNDITFSWTPPDCPGLDFYRFRVGTQPDGGWFIDTTVSKDSSSTTRYIDKENQTLYWSVWSHKADGTEVRGETWSFTIDKSVEPPVPTPIPGTWSVQYFRNKELSDQCASTSYNDYFVFQDWGDGAPDGACNSDNWSARFVRTVTLQGGDYSFAVEADDWARLYVNGELVVNKWDEASQHYEGRNLASGTYEIKVEFADTLGAAKVSAWWWGPSYNIPHESQSLDQWYGEYWLNQTQWWDAFAKVNEGTGILDHTGWGMGSPGWDIPADHFSARFKRRVEFDCGRYRFYLTADDGSKVTIDGVEVYNHWSGSTGDVTFDLDLSQGYHDIQVDYYENEGAASLKFDWAKLSGCQPAAPVLSSPSDGSNLSWDTNTTLLWNTSTGATQYNATIQSNTGLDLSSDWINSTEWNIGILSPGLYTWSVTARNDSGSSDPSSTWSFTIQQPPPPPDPFNKSNPGNGVTGLSTSLTLQWGSSSGATSYQYCYATSNIGICDGSWVSVGSSTSANISGLSNNTTYYWQVEAISANGTTDADGGTWWSFTTAAATPTRTSTATRTVTPRATATRTATPTKAPTRTSTATRTATFTATPTKTPTRTSTATRTATRTGTLTKTPTHTSTATRTATRTATLTRTPTRTYTATRTATRIATPSATATRTPQSWSLAIPLVMKD